MKSLYLIKFPNSFHQDPSSSTNIPVTDFTSLRDALMQDKQASQPSDCPYLDILQNVFHHQHFQDIQREAIECIVADKDALIVIPTGRGKSLCYWIPGLSTPGVTVVITPLMALQSDQVNKLKNYGISGEFKYDNRRKRNCIPWSD